MPELSRSAFGLATMIRLMIRPMNTLIARSVTRLGSTLPAMLSPDPWQRRDRFTQRRDAGTASPLAMLALLLACLTGCATPGLPFLGDPGDNETLAVGETKSIHFLARERNYDAGVTLVQGSRYTLSVSYLSNWVDSKIEQNEAGEAISESGFDNSLMAVPQLGSLRRSRRHNWFELMLFQPSCRGSSLKGVTDLEQLDDGYRFTAACDGNLHLFVNDAPGFYLNNQGYANLSLSRID
jgi:hypothetical protein